MGWALFLTVGGGAAQVLGVALVLLELHDLRQDVAAYETAPRTSVRARSRRLRAQQYRVESPAADVMDAQAAAAPVRRLVESLVTAGSQQRRWWGAVLVVGGLVASTAGAVLSMVQS